MLALSKRLRGSGVAGALFVLSSVVVPTLAVTGQARAADHPVNQLEMKARESFAAGRYDEALQTFAKLYAETLHPVYLRNIGRCHQKMREPQKAIDAFQDYLAKTKTGKEKIGADEHAEIEGYIKDMTALRDEQARAAAAPTPPVPVTPLPGTTSAARPLPAAPPPVEPVAPTSNPPAATLTATAPPPAQGEHHPIYTRWWFWTIIGVAIVGGVVGAVALSGGTTKPTCTAPGGCM
jgi:hypothetical protein